MPKAKVSVLNIGSSSVNAVIGVKGVNNCFSVHGVGECEYAGFLDGEFLEEDKLVSVFAKAISAAEGSAKYSSEKLYVGVPADFSICVTKSVTLNFTKTTKITKKQIDEVFENAHLSDDFKNYLHISTSVINAKIDDKITCYEVIGRKAKKVVLNVSIIYAEKEFIKLVNNILKQLGINYVQYLSTVLAEANYLLDSKTKKAIVINCGHICTSVAVVENNCLTSLKTFAVGGGYISADLSQCLDITYDEANTLRQQIVLSTMPSDDDDYELMRNQSLIPLSMKKVNNITSARIEMIAKLVDKCLVVNNIEKTQYNCYLTGGGIASVKGGLEQLSLSLNVKINALAPNDLFMKKPKYSSILGIFDTAIKIENKVVLPLCSIYSKKKKEK